MLKKAIVKKIISPSDNKNMYTSWCNTSCAYRKQK